jgi:hypothetical protein
MAIKARSCGRRECQLVPRDVISVSVRHEAAGLTAADIDTESGGREKQSVVVMEHTVCWPQALCEFRVFRRKDDLLARANWLSSES